MQAIALQLVSIGLLLVLCILVLMSMVRDKAQAHKTASDAMAKLLDRYFFDKDKESGKTSFEFNLSNALSGIDSDQTQILALKEEKGKLVEEVAQLKSSKKIETIERDHLVTMQQEKHSMELDRKKLEVEETKVDLTNEYKDKELELQKDFFEKANEIVAKGQKRQDEAFDSILEKLPHVTVKQIDKREY